MVTYLFCLIALLLSTPLLSMEEPVTTDSQGNTPLHLATNQNVGDHVVQNLIKAQADVNAQNNEGDTPLHLAYRQVECLDEEFTEDQKDAEPKQKIIYLLEAGARINIKNNLGALPYTHTKRLLMWHIYTPCQSN